MFAFLIVVCILVGFTFWLFYRREAKRHEAYERVMKQPQKRPQKVDDSYRRSQFKVIK